jgi:hypothetical protein
VEETWYDLPPFPSHIRTDVISELARMAEFREGQIPGKGVLDESFGEVRLRWIVAMTTVEGECMLKRITIEMKPAANPVRCSCIFNPIGFRATDARVAVNPLSTFPN